MDKAYDANLVEDSIYAAWEKSGYFTPENLPNLENRTESFSIVLPPPNVTGTLHMGHAVMLAIEDALVRYHRMKGDRTLWLPGTDHAAIATQTKVEKIIYNEEGKTRHDLGREKFLERVEAFAQESHDTIVNQMKKMGASVDWTREAYTLDDARNLAVKTAFKRMYDDGLIYRDYRVVNWDPVGQTTISDDELVYKETKTILYTFRYNKDFPIAISTTRPETKVGDTAVAVNPDDERYKEFVGKTFDVDFAGTNLKIKVVADEDVDASFGTGALGVTPAHSAIDADIAKRHDLPMRQVIDENAVMTNEAGPLASGQSTLEARKIIAEWLRENKLMEQEEEVTQNLSTAERTGGVVEPLPKLQWFIDVNKEFAFKQSDRHPIEGLKDGQMVTLKGLMKHVVEASQVKILPDRFNKTYFHWIDNLRDWNISRQIWFGHRVPVWYKGDETYVDIEQPEGEGWEQDPDTLDTWFSSGLWTFSTLGWPNEDAPDLKTYHPTSVLETGYDILFFWVARMVLMTTYHMGEIPFEHVYLHGLVRDEKGRKMSKSLDNIINPLDMIEEYGADATRLSLLIGGTPGNDMKLSVEKIASFRNFTNKLWNISRYVFSSVENVEGVENVEPKTLADKWILARLSEVTNEVTDHFEKFELSLLGEKLRAFTWSDFADWYVEIAKIQKQNGDSETTDKILLYVLESLLKLWHPFMPFVTEEIYKRFGENGMLLVEQWPSMAFEVTSEEQKQFSQLQEVITAIRHIRSTYNVAPSRKMSATITNGEEFEPSRQIIEALARLEELHLVAEVEKPKSSASAVVGDKNIYVPLEGLVDFEKERERLKKELEEVGRYAESLTRKLDNKQFVENAPKDVVEAERERLEEAKVRAEHLSEELASLD